jgi:hypothetical protein
LSFLDCISCGFGAVLLLFVMINARGVANRDAAVQDLSGEVNRIKMQVLHGEKERVLARNTMDETDDEQARVEGMAKRIRALLDEKKIELAEYDKDTLATKEHVNRLKADIQSAEEGLQRLKAAALAGEGGTKIREFKGDGDRQYLTGIKVGGRRVLILVDASASMLGDTIVDVIIRRNLSDAEKRRSPKWRQVVKTVDWISTQLPGTSQFQVCVFNEDARALIPETAGTWMDASDPAELERALKALERVVPANGTSLENALRAAAAMSPPPDNLFLLVDGLPTMGAKKPRKGNVSAAERLKLFNRAVKELGGGIPVNVILYPMEGDPMAASAYWQLAIGTRGSFFSPSEDWP